MTCLQGFQRQSGQIVGAYAGQAAVEATEGRADGVTQISWIHGAVPRVEG